MFELKKSPAEERPEADVAQLPMIEARELRKIYNGARRWRWSASPIRRRNAPTR